MKKALVIGIDHYASLPALHGCVNDAYAVKTALERHGDGSVNFDCKLLTASGPSDALNRAELRRSIQELFDGDPEIALLYFAGHGHIDVTGGYIATSDTSAGDDGIALGDIIAFANNSAARNKVLLLDSCRWSPIWWCRTVRLSGQAVTAGMDGRRSSLSSTSGARVASAM